ncbi:MAG: DNA-deoxyinosine glycosylase [Treponema sp.]|nr:DNA-deoxyinosine glycosylase [Treponema sp.]
MQHPIPPVYDSNSKILILGSFPSVKSREAGFFYGHPQNRFWKVLAALLKDSLPLTLEEKRAFLILHGIALWDVIASCSITGSSDASIKDVVPNDISHILSAAQVAQVFTNGKTADSLYKKYLLPQTKRESICLPSTSPANAAWTFEKLCAKWKKILFFL